MAELNALSLSDFTALLASDAPAPGGGSVAALEGALGAALTAMVCALTQGRKKYAEFAADAESIRLHAARLQAELRALVQEDTDGFCQVSAAYAMPKATPEEQSARKQAIAAAMRLCTETPWRVMTLSAEALRLAERLLGRFNTTAASDLGCAVLSLKAAMQGAWLNILINTSGNDALSAQYRPQAQALLAESLASADRIYDTICAML